MKKFKYLMDNFSLRHEIRKLNKKIKIIEDNNEFLMDENAVLKAANRKKYITCEEKIRFLTKRENKLQTIEYLVKSNNIEKAIVAVSEDL